MLAIHALKTGLGFRCRPISELAAAQESGSSGDQAKEILLPKAWPWAIFMSGLLLTHILLHLFILIGGHGGEDGLWEAEGMEDAAAGAEEAVCLHDVETRLIAMHGVKDDLGEESQGGGQTTQKVSPDRLAQLDLWTSWDAKLFPHQWPPRLNC